MLSTDDEGRACDQLAEEGKHDYECKLSCRVDYIRVRLQVVYAVYSPSLEPMQMYADHAAASCARQIGARNISNLQLHGVQNQVGGEAHRAIAPLPPPHSSSSRLQPEEDRSQRRVDLPIKMPP